MAARERERQRNPVSFPDTHKSRTAPWLPLYRSGRGRRERTTGSCYAPCNTVGSRGKKAGHLGEGGKDTSHPSGVMQTGWALSGWVGSGAPHCQRGSALDAASSPDNREPRAPAEVSSG